MTALPLLKNFERIVFFTGAGMSAESGVPTFRGKGGIWKEYNYEEYACQKAFDRHPEKVWDFHNYRRGLVARCEPNQGHRIVASCQQQKPGALVVTQNIDGLHHQAGSERVIELHGNLWRLRCDACGARSESRNAPLVETRCTGCGKFWRPDIVWFGDSLSPANIKAALDAIQACQLLISIGTSAVVYPAAEMPLRAKSAGAVLVEINPEETPLSEAFDVCLRGTASEMLARMAEGLVLSDHPGPLLLAKADRDREGRALATHEDRALDELAVRGEGGDLFVVAHGRDAFFEISPPVRLTGGVEEG